MFDEYEESLEWFLQTLSTSDPDFFTDEDWQLIRVYTRSDGCSMVSNWHEKACWEHDFYFRTHHDFSGRVISFSRSNFLFLRRICKLSIWGILNVRAYLRFFAVSLFGHGAWKGQKLYRL